MTATKTRRHILLISANQVTEPYPVYPIGLSYLATHLSKHLPAFDISLFDMNVGGWEELTARLQELSPKFIGISLRNIDDIASQQNDDILQGYTALMRTVRAHSDACVIIGGAGFSIYPTILFDALRPDFGITGDGEESLLRLIQCLEHGDPHDRIDGLVYASEARTVHRPHRAYCRDGSLKYDDALVPYYWRHGGMLNIQTKRGCPHHCIYCTYPLIEGREVRTLDPDAIVASVAAMKSRHGVDYFFFTDSVFNIGDAYNHELARKLIDSRVGVRWWAYFSPHGLEEDSLRMYQEAGLTHIEFGTESLSDRQLKNYGKHFSVHDVLASSDLCNRVGIHFAHFLILGGYGETETTLDETFGNSRCIENTVLFPFLGMRIYPGTPLASIAIQEGLITSDDDLLAPTYYLSQNIDTGTIKIRARQTGRRWIFPDDDVQGVLEKMRAKQWKGPLWEHAKY